MVLSAHTVHEVRGEIHAIKIVVAVFVRTES